VSDIETTFGPPPAGSSRHPLDQAVAAMIDRVAETVPAFTDRLAAAGVVAADLDSVASLDDLPLMDKGDLLAAQHADPPFGGWLARDARPVRVFQSPGPLYEPQDRDDTWRWQPALEAAGVGPDDVVMVAFSFHLSPAGAMFDEAARTLGATVLPAGIGNTAAQVTAMHDLGVTAYIGLPSYLKAILEAADDDGVQLRVERALVTAEPLPPSLRERLEASVPVVRQTYGTAETGHLGTECDQRDGFHVPDDAIVQVCDLTTGAALADDRRGQVVVSLLRTDYPLVRFGVGDLSAWNPTPCPCGNPAPRLRGWLGRIDDAVKVRGLFLHPAQVAQVVEGVPGIQAHRVVIDRHDHRDVATLEVVVADGAHGEEVAATVEAALRDTVRLRFDVVEVETADEPAFTDRRDW